MCLSDSNGMLGTAGETPAVVEAWPSTRAECWLSGGDVATVAPLAEIHSSPSAAPTTRTGVQAESSPEHPTACVAHPAWISQRLALQLLKSQWSATAVRHSVGAVAADTPWANCPDALWLLKRATERHAPSVRVTGIVVESVTLAWPLAQTSLSHFDRAARTIQLRMFLCHYEAATCVRALTIHLAVAPKTATPSATTVVVPRPTPPPPPPRGTMCFAHFSPLDEGISGPIVEWPLGFFHCPAARGRVGHEILEW